ncbi:putative ubiquitin-conjugating enzyme E2 23 [Orobanche minor]
MLVDFEQIVFEHFRKRGRYILKACDAYMKGHLIGSLAKDASGNNSLTNSNPVGFKLLLAKVLPKLLSALNEVGAECREFEHLTKL